jgi:flagellar capping protein FliD
MKLEDYRNEVKSILVRLDTRQEEIYHRLSRIDLHLEKLNSKVAIHESDLVRIKTIGMVCVIIVPIVINIIMENI